LSWTSPPNLVDLDVTLLDASGHVVRRGDSIDGGSILAAAEGLAVLGPAPAGTRLQVRLKGSGSPVDCPFDLQQETATAVVTGYADVGLLPAASASLVALELGRRVMTGRGTSFEAASAISRGEVARAVALAGERPQRIPAAPSFNDVDASD